MHFLKVSPERIRNIYATILEADLPDFIETSPGSQIRLMATGNEIHVIDDKRKIEFVMHDDARGHVRVDQKLEFQKERIFNGIRVKTYWDGVYHEGRSVKSLDFYETLERIGDHHDAI